MMEIGNTMKPKTYENTVPKLAGFSCEDPANSGTVTSDFHLINKCNSVNPNSTQ